VQLPGAKLYFTLSGTSTPSPVYTTEDLDTEHSDPVVADASGDFPAIFMDSDITLRARLTDADDVTISTTDGINSDVDTSVVTGTFTATLTGFTTTVTGTVNYRIHAGICWLYNLGSSIQGTSNATTMTMTGMPTACKPATTDRYAPCIAQDNGSSKSAGAAIQTSGTITFSVDDPLSASGFTNSGTKGLWNGWTLSYPL
jgi:hypothetical protein